MTSRFQKKPKFGGTFRMPKGGYKIRCVYNDRGREDRQMKEKWEMRDSGHESQVTNLSQLFTKCFCKLFVSICKLTPLPTEAVL